MHAEPFYFDIGANGIAVFLGPTEARLMELAWTHGTLTVKSALARLGPDREPAYTTVMTVLNRLAEKGLLTRVKDGRNFSFQPVMNREDFIQTRVSQVASCLGRNFPGVSNVPAKRSGA